MTQNIGHPHLPKIHCLLAISSCSLMLIGQTSGALCGWKAMALIICDSVRGVGRGHSGVASDAR